LFVVLLSSPSALSQSTTSTTGVASGACGGNGLLENSQCICYSGFVSSTDSDQDCNVEAPGTCVWQNSSATFTGGASSLNSTYTSYLGNNLTLTVQSPIVVNRTLTQIQVGGSADPACSYPGPNFVKSLLDCQDTFTGVIPWSAHALCNFTEDNTDPDYLIYSAPIYVTNSEDMELRGHVITQTVTNVLNIAVQFPKQISISTNVQVVAPVNMYSAVTQQSYSPSSGTGTISFATSLEWPFSVQGGSIASVPTGLTVSGSLTETTLNGDCTTAGNSTCYQSFTYEILPGNVCQLTGAYVIDFTVVCRGTQECPLDINTDSAVLTLTLQSADFCATLRTGVTVTAQLSSYEDSAHTASKSAFLIDQTGYFSVLASSPQANISQTEFLSISFSQGDTVTTLYTSTAGISNAAVLSAVSNGANSATFAIDFLASLFVVPTDQSLQYGFTVEIQLSFLDNSAKKKRTIYAQQSTTSSTATSQVSLEAATVSDKAHHSSAITACVEFALLGSLLLLSIL